MAVGMLLSGEAVTRETYRAVTEKMFGGFPMSSEQSPDGLIVHSAGDSEQGFYVYDIWESKEAFQRFAEAQLLPALTEILGDLSGGPQPVFFEVEALVHGRAA